MGTSLEKRKQARRQIIFDLIKNQNGTLSRNDLCKKASCSMTAVAEAVDDLIRNNLVFETENAEQRIGRPPVLLSINSQAFYFIGVECSSYAVNIQVLNSLDESVYSNNMYLTSPSANDLLACIKDILTVFSTNYPEIWMAVPCITVSLPGTMDSKTGIGISYSSIADWKMVDVKSYLQQHFTKDFIFMHNIDSMLIGYRFLKRIPEDDSTLFIMIRNGTGIRFFAKHTLLSDFGVVCEFGHAKAVNSNRVCACGKRGCYDSEITTYAIINKLREYMVLHDAGLSSRFEEVSDDHEFILEFFRLVREGNPYALEIFNDCSLHIANLLSQVLLVSNADTVVLSTEMCHIMPLFRENIYSGLSANRVFLLPQIDFVLPQNDFGAIGAALSGYQNIFSKLTDIRF